MSHGHSNSHMSRITNCLQTILDLEPQLKRLEVGKSLLSEFAVLKEFLSKAEFVDLSEEDVLRIEKATTSFLEELRTLLDRESDGEQPSSPVQ